MMTRRFTCAAVMVLIIALSADYDAVRRYFPFYGNAQPLPDAPQKVHCQFYHLISAASSVL